MLNINSLGTKSYNNIFLISSLLFVCLFLSMFSPILSYLFSILFLILFNNKLSKVNLLRWGYVLVVAYSLLLIYSSRSFENELISDLSRYFYEYTKMVKMDIDEYIIFGDGLELGYHVLYTAVAYFLPNIKPIDLAICNVVITLALFYIWIENYLFINDEYKNDKAIICALIFIFFAFVSIGYLQRQALSIVFLLYALSAKRFTSFMIFASLSTVFHLTSLPLIIIYKFLARFRLSFSRMLFFLILFILTSLLIRYYFYGLISLVMGSGLSIPGIHKLNFYSEFNFSVLSVKNLVLNLLLLSILVLNWSRVDLFWRNIILFSMLTYFVFLGVPLLSERINFILFFLFGFFFYLVSIKASNNMLNRRIYISFILLYFSLDCFKNVVMATTSEYEYWNAFDFIGYYPFYYFDLL
ncbi:ABC transporter ATP-binding protein [Vibrio cholerae]|nr:EpsG family protein [Vibrio cholerae]TQQ09570.1 ABC transporter ATP-binding protein [Vibrio cholerae]